MIFYQLQNYKNMKWYLRSTKLRSNISYYISYYLTLNTVFATILPIGALLFFSFSTIRGLNTIRKSFKTSVPMRMSTRKQKTSFRHTVEGEYYFFSYYTPCTISRHHHKFVFYELKYATLRNHTCNVILQPRATS